MVYSLFIQIIRTVESLIFDIQRFSIHDGAGIRTVVFFKGCNLNCPWCQNPESIDHRPEIAFYADKCTQNADCVEVCPLDAITIGSATHIDRELCDRCGKCTEVCVIGALKKIGSIYSVEEVMRQLLKDKPYYETSGGGVTFSGGEPTLHADFILEVLKECEKHDIRTNIETNGYFKWEKFEHLLPYLNQIYFDLKIVDQKRNRDVLGGDSQRILANMDLLLEHNAPVEFRIPLIPDHTADDENLRSLVNVLKEKGISKVHLLPYHSMGEAKAARICSPLIDLNQKPFDTAQLNVFQQMFESERIETELYR